MKVMLDTNICIYLIKQQPPNVIERFLSHPVGDIGISSITVAELAYGVNKSRQAAKNRLALEQFLAPLHVAVFDQDAALSCGRLCAQLAQKDSPIGSMDLLIAAHALTVQVRLVTNNLATFDAFLACGLKTGCNHLSGKAHNHFSAFPSGRASSRLS